MEDKEKCFNCGGIHVIGYNHDYNLEQKCLIKGKCPACELGYLPHRGCAIAGAKTEEFIKQTESKSYF